MPRGRGIPASIPPLESVWPTNKAGKTFLRDALKNSRSSLFHFLPRFPVERNNPHLSQLAMPSLWFFDFAVLSRMQGRMLLCDFSGVREREIIVFLDFPIFSLFHGVKDVTFVGLYYYLFFFFLIFIFIEKYFKFSISHFSRFSCLINFFQSRINYII